MGFALEKPPGEIEQACRWYLIQASLPDELQALPAKLTGREQVPLQPEHQPEVRSRIQEHVGMLTALGDGAGFFEVAPGSGQIALGEIEAAERDQKLRPPGQIPFAGESGQRLFGEAQSAPGVITQDRHQRAQGSRSACHAVLLIRRSLALRRDQTRLSFRRAAFGRQNRRLVHQKARMLLALLRGQCLNSRQQPDVVAPAQRGLRHLFQQAGRQFWVTRLEGVVHRQRRKLIVFKPETSPEVKFADRGRVFLRQTLAQTDRQTRGGSETTGARRPAPV